MVKLSEKILFDVNVDMIEGDVETFNYCLDTTTETDVPENFHHMLYAVLANAKATEPDEIIPVNKGSRRPGNRAERRKATEHKKNSLGRESRYANEYINAYFVMEDGSTRWIKDIIKENSWDEFDSIDWSKVKGINPKNYGYKQYNRKPEIVASRRNGKSVCRSYVPDNSEVPNIWDYTDEEKAEVCADHLHGDFSDDDINRIIAENNPFRRMVEAWGCDDDWDYDYWDEYNDCPYPSIDDLEKEIETYKDFLNAFNLNTLFQHWKDNY